MYIQPNVEAAEVQATSLMQAVSPAEFGIGNGGSTTGIPGGGTSVPGE